MSRVRTALLAAACAVGLGGMVAAAPAEARTFVSVGVGLPAPVYSGYGYYAPYAAYPYPGYGYAPYGYPAYPYPAYYGYYGRPHVVIGGGWWGWHRHWR